MSLRETTLSASPGLVSMDAQSTSGQDGKAWTILSRNSRLQAAAPSNSAASMSPARGVDS